MYEHQSHSSVASTSQTESCVEGNVDATSEHQSHSSVASTSQTESCVEGNVDATSEHQCPSSVAGTSQTESCVEGNVDATSEHQCPSSVAGTSQTESWSEENDAREHKCPDCDYAGPSMAALRMHRKRIHGYVRGPRHLEECPVCKSEVQDIEGLIKHVAEDHEFQCEVRKINFSSTESFEAWKEDTERITVTYYSKHKMSTSAKKIQYSYYKCHRSGEVKTRSTGLRCPHTRIVTKSCTAFLKVKKNLANQSINVEFCATHLGHQLEPQFLPLSHSNINEIGILLKNKFSIPQITRSIRDSHTNKNDRLYWCTSQDVRNVARSLNIQPGKRHENDLRSVGIRVEENDLMDGIRFYTPPTETGDELSHHYDAYPVEMAPIVFIGGHKLGRYPQHMQIQHQVVDRYGSRRSG